MILKEILLFANLCTIHGEMRASYDFYFRREFLEIKKFDGLLRDGRTNYEGILSGRKVNPRFIKICLLFGFTNILLRRIFKGQSSIYSVRLISQMIRGISTPIFRLMPLRASNNISGARRIIWISAPTYHEVLGQESFKLMNQNLKLVLSKLSTVQDFSQIPMMREMDQNLWLFISKLLTSDAFTQEQMVAIIYDAAVNNDTFVEYEKRILGFRHYLMTDASWNSLNC
jgi:hypothetical protein